MQKLTIIAVCLFISVMASAQSPTPKVHEAGITFNNLDNFGMTYRVGNDKSLWRFGTVFISGSITDTKSANTNSNNKQGGIGFEIGKEGRKPISENFVLRYGLDLAFSYSGAKGETNNSANSSKASVYSNQLQFVLGSNFKIADNLFLGAEILPNVGYSHSVNTTVNNDLSESKVTRNQFFFGLSNGSARLSMVYRF